MVNFDIFLKYRGGDMDRKTFLKIRACACVSEGEGGRNVSTALMHQLKPRRALNLSFFRSCVLRAHARPCGGSAGYLGVHDRRFERNKRQRE